MCNVFFILNYVEKYLCKMGNIQKFFLILGVQNVAFIYTTKTTNIFR
jgi:hypothetical protein